MKNHKITHVIDLLAWIDGFAAGETPAAVPHWFKGKSNLWFRGHANKSWTLLPQVLRDEFQELAASFQKSALDPVFALEASIFNRLRRQGAFLIDSSMTMVETYFVAQHHGMPTRLLDWTANPLAALFFAVESLSSEDACVYALKSRAEVPGAEEDDVVYQENTRVVRVVEALAKQETPPAEGGLPLRIMPNLNRGRMLQQEARFTLHQPGCRDLTGMVSKAVIRSEHKRRIRDQLRQCGVHRGTLFPDLANLVAEIRFQAGTD